MSEKLEGLYQEARKSLKAKNYTRASDLLRQILLIDENYKDASRLLAQTVKLRRRRWYNHPLLWGGLGLVTLVALTFWLAPRLGPLVIWLARIPPVTRTTIITAIPTTLMTPTLSPTSTPFPLTWKRISMFQELPRDTISAMVIDPNDTEVMYIGTENAGVYKSIDGGGSWQPVHNGLARAAIYTLVMDPRDSKILYAGTRFGGVYKTTDGGQIWQAINAGIDIHLNELAIIVMDAQNSQHLYFTQATAIYETQDGGLSWQNVKDGSGRCPYSFVGLVADPTDSNILYTADWGESIGSINCQGGVYKSTDSGRTWTITNFRSESGEIQLNTLWIEPTAGQTLYIKSGWTGMLWVSNDKGGTWMESNSSNCTALVFDSQDLLTAYCGNWAHVMKTTDGGKTWGLESNPGVETPNLMAISPQDRNTLFWGGAGLNISTDGAKTWEKHGSGLGGSSWELKIPPISSSVLIAQVLDTRIFLSKDGGRSWETIGSGRSLSFDPSGKNLYSLDNNRYLTISTDDGTTWEPISLPAANPMAFVVHPVNLNRVYALYSLFSPPYIYYSDDLGKTWQGSKNMQDIKDPRLFFDHDQGTRVYAVGDLQISRSNDSGLSWQNCADSAMMLWASKSDMRAVVDFRNSDSLYVATRGNGIVASSDGCQSWQTSNTGLGSLFVNTIAIDPNHPDTIYAGTDGGAYASFDTGETWNEINDGLLGATVVYSIVIDKDSNVYAATPYGIFKLGLK